MTFANSVEGLVNLLEPSGQHRSDVDETAIRGLVKHINAWQGGESLKQNAIQSVRRASRTTTARTLRQLVAADAIPQNQVDAWIGIRNKVMHGNLISPYPTGEEESDKLMKLAAMMHSLTGELMRRS